MPADPIRSSIYPCEQLNQQSKIVWKSYVMTEPITPYSHMEIRNLAEIDFDTVFRGFERAFSDYEIRFEKEEVRGLR